MTQPRVHPAASHDQARADFKRKQRAALIGAAVNLPLALVKILVGYFGASQALVADGIDSASDILCDALVLGAVRIGRHRADVEHPYGHARIETAATTLVALFLLLTAAGIGYVGILGMTTGAPLAEPSAWALLVAAASVALKEGLYWYTWRIARRAKSSLLETNAWHHRSDAFTSAVALVAIAGAMAGMPVFDAIGALVIAVFIAVIGLRYGWQSFRELVDTGLSPDRLAVVREQIATVPGVRRMRRLRTRTMGGHDAFADVGVFVDPYISLTEAHRISEAITARLVHHVDEIADICVHIEPDGHADSSAAHALPLREQMLPRLQAAWQYLDIAPAIRRVTLHYLDDRIEVELLLPLAYAADHARLQYEFDAIAGSVNGVSLIRLMFVDTSAWGVRPESE